MDWYIKQYLLDYIDISKIDNMDDGDLVDITESISNIEDILSKYGYHITISID